MLTSLVPARFLTLTAHLVITIVILWARVSHLNSDYLVVYSNCDMIHYPEYRVFCLLYSNYLYKIIMSNFAVCSPGLANASVQFQVKGRVNFVFFGVYRLGKAKLSPCASENIHANVGHFQILSKQTLLLEKCVIQDEVHPDQFCFPRVVVFVRY